jgi:hypothetical protein
VFGTSELHAAFYAKDVIDLQERFHTKEVEVQAFV